LGAICLVSGLTWVECLFDSAGVGAEVAQVSRVTQATQAAQLAGVTQRHDDDVAPGEAVLPVLPALRELLPAGGLRRGSVVATGCWSLLCLALVAEASADGAWCAVVGLPELGVAAAADAGLVPDRMLLVADPGSGWLQVVASLLDGCDLVLLRPPDQPPAQARRRLEATVRRSGGVLVVAGDWDGAQTRFTVADQEWTGIGAGHGRLRARRVRVVADGRGAGARAQDRWLWLPGPDGSVTLAEPAPAARWAPAEDGALAAGAPAADWPPAAPGEWLERSTG
jgi:hypothetical protein